MSDRPAAEIIKVRDSAAVWREIDDETVLLALDSSTYLSLNRTSTELWPLMVAGTTRNELVNHLVARFEVDTELAAADIDALVDACREHGLLAAER